MARISGEAETIYEVRVTKREKKKTGEPVTSKRIQSQRAAQKRNGIVKTQTDSEKMSERRGMGARGQKKKAKQHQGALGVHKESMIKRLRKIRN